MADNERIDILIDHLLRYPERHSQQHWYGHSINGGIGLTLTPRKFLASLGSDCGTTACAGGWIDALFGGSKKNPTVDDTNDLIGFTAPQGTYVFFDTMTCEDPEGAVVRALKYIRDNPRATKRELQDHEDGGR